jgi:quinol monooxygenase YgiN
MKLYIFARFHARLENERALADTLLAVSAPTRAEPGCLGHQVFRSTQDPKLFYIQSAWMSEEAFEEHVGLPHTLLFVERVEPLIDHPLEVARTELCEEKT